ncbi:MAG: centromere-associated protein K-domain-containing protein [Benniella sp.]|nr:MAG: centromere-associated protein K-domain-containing protein [Benniella sp.]
MTLSTSLKRPLEDDPVTDATSTISKAKEVDQRVASGMSIDSTGAPVNTTFDTLPPPPQPPTRIPLDPEYVRRREESLRATGEILRQRCNAKLERLNQLKQEYANKQSPPPKSADTLQDQQLAILRLEEARLRADVNQIQANQEITPEFLPELASLRARQMILGSIRDYNIMLPRLKKELEETRAELASETQLLNELKEIHQALQTRRKDLAKTVESGMSQDNNKTKQAIRERRTHVQDLTRELTMFLKKHYPPIQPDPNDPTVFELKDILEDIMNLSVSQPADPYVDLVHGHYHPPHVEQLINAGIAVRHPRDSQKLRLVDFYS